jgi:chromosome segregation ATPase
MSVGSARRRKLEAALENAKSSLETTRAQRDELSFALRELEQGRPASDDALPAQAEATSPDPQRLAARVSELRDLLAVLAPATEEEQGRALESVQRIRESGERAQALTLQLEAARAREDDLTRRTVRDQSTIADLQARVAEFEDIEERMERFERERKDVEASAAELEHQRSRIEDLEERLLAEADRLVELETELEGSRARIVDLDAGRQAADERIAELAEAVELAESQREAALSSLEARLSDVQRLRTHVSEARGVSDSAERQLAELAEALEVAESERDAARTALEARVGDVHRLRDKVAELEDAPAEDQGQPGDPGEPVVEVPASDPADVNDLGTLVPPPDDSIEVRIARVQERLEQTELRVRRALTTAEVSRPSIDLDDPSSDIVDITGRDASRELERLREEVALLSDRAAAADDARRRAEAALEALTNGGDQDAPTVPVDPAPDTLPPAGT